MILLNLKCVVNEKNMQETFEQQIESSPNILLLSSVKNNLDNVCHISKENLLLPNENENVKENTNIMLETSEQQTKKSSVASLSISVENSLDNCNIAEDDLNIEISKSTCKRSVKLIKNEWKRLKTREMRMTGDEYICFQRKGNKIKHNVMRPARKLQPTCTSTFCMKASNRFCSNFSDNQRLQIFNHFWSVSWDEKKTYVSSMVTMNQRKRDTTGVGDDSRRGITFEYCLKYNDNKPVSVCKKMFLGTLGLKESMVHNWVKNSAHGLHVKYSKITITSQNEDEMNLIESSQSLARKTSIANRKQFINKWFESLPKMPSHYCRKQSSRVYLEGPFKDFEQIFHTYKNKCIEDQISPFSKTFFRQYMVEQKLSIYLPRKDKCDECCSYEVGQISD